MINHQKSSETIRNHEISQEIPLSSPDAVRQQLRRPRGLRRRDVQQKPRQRRRAPGARRQRHEPQLQEK
jgi:hypothetical protein